MTYDLLIRNGRVIDGTGSPAFKADVGIRNGRIAAIGKLSGDAARTIDAQGQVIAPGFIDSHTHFDAQITWDPLCTWSCYHGITTVINGNCSLGIAPLRPGTFERVAQYLSYVEAIPVETLSTIKPTWETYGEYLDTIGKRLGMNVGSLVGHTAIRHYVMGSDSQGRDPTPGEIEQMKALVREAIESGALGLSFSMNKGHFDPEGVQIPSLWAKEEELFALAGVVGELGTGVLQASKGIQVEEKSRLMSRLSEKTGRPTIYLQLQHNVGKPGEWERHLEIVEEAVQKGIRAIPHCSPSILSLHFDMHNCQVFRSVPSWHDVLVSNDDALKLKAYADPEFRQRVHGDLIDWSEEMDKTNLGRNWPDITLVEKVKLEKNSKFEGMSIRELAQAQGKSGGKGIIDAFFDLMVEEDLDTLFIMHRRGHDKDVMNRLLNHPNALLGLSDAGAHVQFHASYGYSGVLLGHWVRREKIMTVEAAVKKLTFDQAQAFGIYDRGLLQPGMAADIVVFNPDTIRPLPDEKVFDLPGGAWRMKQLSEGVLYTIVNGQVLIEDGRHTGALPGRLLRNSLYRERQDAAKQLSAAN